MRILNGILYDMKFQLRHGFYYAYIFVSIVYIAFLKLLPESINRLASILIIFTDPSVLGAFFIGAIFLLEKSQNTLQGLFTTPYKIQEYIKAKVISLTILSLLSSMLIAMFIFKTDFNFLLLFIGVFFTSVFFTLLGFMIAIYSKSTNHYFANSIILVIFMLPMLDYFNIFSSKLFYLFPSKASLLLIHGAFYEISFFNLIYSLAALPLWCLAAYALLVKVFYKKVIAEVGGK